MSVLESLKGTFHSVQQDIFDGLRSLTSPESQSRSETLRRLQDDQINLDAGADLLNKFQNSWQEIHEYSTKSAKLAEEVDVPITQLFIQWEKQTESFRRLELEIKEIPALVSAITSLTDTLANLQEDFRKIENTMERLVDVIEENELQKNRTSHIHQLNNHRHVKMAQVEKIKVQLAKDHAKKVEDYERNQQSRLRERQEVFQEAFRQDLSYYRTHGMLERKNLSGEVEDLPKVGSLSDITIEGDPSVLNEFLNPPETPSALVKTPQVAVDEVEDGEHNFIEDDYTDDYSLQGSNDSENEMEELIAQSKKLAAADFEKAYSSNGSLDEVGQEKSEAESSTPTANLSTRDLNKVPSYARINDESVGDSSEDPGGKETLVGDTIGRMEASHKNETGSGDTS